jgi:shikimate kinase
MPVLDPSSHESLTEADAASRMVLDRPIVLVGMMGAGKTTIGWRLAKRLGIGFCDMDRAIEEATGLSVSDIFASHGEAKFRELELMTAEFLLNQPPQVIATGGGAFAEASIRELMNSRALTVWLSAPVDVLLERVSRRDTRPLLRTGDKESILRNLMEKRAPYYAEAHLTVDSTSGAHELVVESILRALAERGVARHG